MRTVAGGLVTIGVCLAAGLAAALAARAVPGRYAPPPCRTWTFHSAADLDAQRVCMNLGVSTHGTAPGTYLFMTPHSAGAGIFRNNGTLVWWQPRPRGAAQDQNLTVVRLWHRTYLAVWSGQGTPTGSNGTVSLYNEHYQRVGRITAGGPYQADGIDQHEFRITPEGDALIGITDPVTRMLGGRPHTINQYVVQKLALVRGGGRGGDAGDGIRAGDAGDAGDGIRAGDGGDAGDGIRAGRVLFQWNSLRDVPVSQSHVGEPATGPWDYFHGNAVAQDTDGNLLISARNTWGIYKVSIRTGHEIWEVGARGDHTLATPWCYQHDITPLGHDRYSLFDNGGTGPGCQPPATGHPSRGIIFAVTPSGRRPKIRLVHAYTHDPPTACDFWGSIQQLHDGDVVINWGNNPVVSEYDASGRIVKLDLSLSIASYRAFQYPWDGQPLTVPAVAAADHGAGTDVWASWNGSTELAAWRVLGGPTPSRLAPVSGMVHRRGFETAIFLSRPYAAVAVQALDREDRVLRTSRTISPAP